MSATANVLSSRMTVPAVLRSVAAFWRTAWICHPRKKSPTRENQEFQAQLSYAEVISALQTLTVSWVTDRAAAYLFHSFAMKSKLKIELHS